MKNIFLLFLSTLILTVSFPLTVSAQNVRQENYCDAFGGVCGCDETTGKQVCCEGVLNETFSCQQPSRLIYPSYAQAFPATTLYATAVPNERGTFSIYVNWADNVPTEYSITLTRIPGQDPGPFADTPTPEFTFFDIQTGVWYANIKKNINGQWSQITSWKIVVPEWSSEAAALSNQAVVIDREPGMQEPGRIIAPAAHTKRASQVIQDLPGTVLYVVLFLIALFAIVIVSIVTGRNKMSKLEEYVHKMRLDISTIMNVLRKKYPEEKKLVSHSQIKLNGILSAEEKRIIQEVEFEKIYTKHHTYFIDKITSFNPKTADDLAYAAYQTMEQIDNKEIKHQIEQGARKHQRSMHDVNVACADYLAIKANDEVLK